jgi:hypothetical protein
MGRPTHDPIGSAGASSGHSGGLFDEGVRACEPEFAGDRPGTEENTSSKGLNGSAEAGPAPATADIEPPAAAAPADAGVPAGTAAGRPKAPPLPPEVAGPAFAAGAPPVRCLPRGCRVALSSRQLAVSISVRTHVEVFTASKWIVPPNSAQPPYRSTDGELDEIAWCSESRPAATSRCRAAATGRCRT